MLAPAGVKLRLTAKLDGNFVCYGYGGLPDLFDCCLLLLQSLLLLLLCCLPL